VARKASVERSSAGWRTKDTPSSPRTAETTAREKTEAELLDVHLDVRFERKDVSEVGQLVALFQWLAGIERSPELLLNAFGLTRALAREIGLLGITVNAVTPGVLRTAQPSEHELRLIQQTPLRQAETADEVAGIVNMLCDDKAGYSMGQCLSIDGGLS